MRKTTTWQAARVLVLLSVGMGSSGHAQTFQTLVSFNGTDGAGPSSMSLIQGTDGNLYGSTTQGGSKSCGNPHGCGTLFKMTATGLLKTLYAFCAQTNCADGTEPDGGLVLGTDENFYGTTVIGGGSGPCSAGCGTVFKITREGTLTTLHSFDGADGNYPVAVLVEGTDGNFYGTTEAGGNSVCTGGCGTIFKITTAGKLTTLHYFQLTDGVLPVASLVEGTDGNFYGTAAGGGSYDAGTIFKISPRGVFRTLHNFTTDGETPEAALIQASDGNFDGTTLEGVVYGYGTVFKVSPQGKLSTVLSFNGGNGFFPYDPLVQATDGNFYGTTAIGGEFSCGTVFELMPGGPPTVLHTFEGNNSDGCDPLGGLFQATNGTLYGDTYAGGGSFSVCSGRCGTIFSENIGLSLFVITVPTARKVGQSVIILGTNLTGTTSVTFNGTAATFKVVSATEITTTVRSGATTGTVQVVTPGETLSSNEPFRVLR